MASKGKSVNEKLTRVRRLCLEQAQSFVEAAEHLGEARWPHLVYHLSLLALEEVGKASMLSAQMLSHAGVDRSWLERSMDSHRRKLQWAVWSPLTRIDPGDFEAARQFAERAHALRLASLYVDAKAELTDLPPKEQVSPKDAADALALARARLDAEQGQGTPTGEIEDLTAWFLDTMDDAEEARLILSRGFIAKFEEMGGDARVWALWAREEMSRLDREAREALEVELAKPGVAKEVSKPRWRANAIVFTPSHSLRPKVLAKWNEKIRSVQLLWTGKKDQLTLQVTLKDNEPLPTLSGRLSSLSKLVVACLNIGSIGYFWFERPGFEKQLFSDVQDLELRRPMQFGPTGSFWGDGRAVALNDEHIEHAIRCMMAFAPLPDSEAEPIFKPYLDGLAMVAKSDIFYSFDALARIAFIRSLAAALRRYGTWSGESSDFERAFHVGFEPFMPEREHREQMFQALTPSGDSTETSLDNLRSAKQLADLYLLHLSHRLWRNLLNGP
jgi:AbiV family abortive infection protein